MSAAASRHDREHHEAPSSTKHRDRRRDPDMRHAKKGQQRQGDAEKEIEEATAYVEYLKAIACFKV